MSFHQDGHASGLSGPLVTAFPIVPNDAVDLPNVTRQLRITGQGGMLAVLWLDGAQTLEPVAAGETLDWRIRRVLATGTTATGVRGYL